MKIKAVLFDMDGTVTRPYLDFDKIRAEIGIEKGSVLEAIDKMDSDCQSRAMAILHRYEQEGADQSQLNDGVVELLQWLLHNGYRTGLVTRNQRQHARRVCDMHHIVFDCIISREDGPVKPDPFAIVTACRQLGITPQETLMVGDFRYDLLCGRAAGSKTILITTSDCHRDFQHEADFVIERLMEIPAIIQQLE